MRPSPPLALFVGILCLFFSGCARTPVHAGRVNHVVLCWLKNPGNEPDRRKIIDASQSFRKIPGVLGLEVGTPIQSDRDIVDDSFDVAICVALVDRRSLDAYLVHPIHVKARQDVLLPLVKRTVVYDFED